MSRTDQITERLTQHVQSMGHAVVTPDRASWASYPLPARFKFGWMPPVPLSDRADEEQLIVSFCPELLDVLTEHLDDDLFDTYLTALETYIDLHIAWHGQPPSAINKVVEDTLYEQAPAALELVNLVELRALDQGLVST
jgi:hypothetical protein